MPNYYWLDYADEPLEERYPREEVLGVDDWTEFVSSGLTTDGLATLRGSLEEIRTSPILQRLTPPCPRLFVSHRLADVDPACRIAQLATKEGFGYWLDVVDPHLQAIKSLPSGTLTPEQEAILTAGIIEMGLVNSSHVIAVLTTSTPGSWWVPYEYGRIAYPPEKFLLAGTWTDPRVVLSPFPDYMHLGKEAETEQEIKTWLRTELSRWQSTYHSCDAGARAEWRDDVRPTQPLPRA